jgi:hypothetical protein
LASGDYKNYRNKILFFGVIAGLKPIRFGKNLIGFKEI